MSKSLWPHELQHAITISQTLLKILSIKSVLSNHLILCHPLLLLLSIFPSIRDFSNESAVSSRWPKYWSFNFIISPFNEYAALISLKSNWFWLPCYPRDSQVFSSTIVGKYQFFIAPPPLQSRSSQISCQEANIFWSYGCSHHPQWS